MDRDIDFYKSYEHSVEVHHDEFGYVGRARLTFGDGKWPHLKFEGSLETRKLIQGQKYQRLKAISDTGGIFTLFDCDYQVFYAHANFLAEGDVEAKFKKIFVRYADVSEWFLQGQFIQGDVGETLAWVNKPEPIEVEVRTSDEHFSLVTEVRRTTDHSGEDFIINEHVLFEFERLAGFFDVADVREKCLELSSFISILIACPFSIISVGVDSETAGFGYVYFPSFKKVERGGRGFSWTSCLMQKRMLDGRWQDILGNYYKSEHRKVVWARLAGMQRYDSFWEYMALGYISLLDKVVKKKSKGKTADVVPPSQEKIDAFNAKTMGLSESLTEAQKTEVLSIINQVFSWKDRTFARNFKSAVSLEDDRVMKIINISDEDFSLIKGVRDDIAHGHAIDLGDDGHGRVSKVIRKVELLLTYWAYIDFGLKSDDFIACLKATHNSSVLNSDIDRVYLERITGTSDFYEVSEKRFEEISSIKGVRIQSCFTRDSNGEVTYSEEYTQMLKSWMDLNKGGAMKPLEIFGINDDLVKCSGTAYVECGDKRLDLHHIYVIDQN